jgi:hypothetical protein
VGGSLYVGEHAAWHCSMRIMFGRYWTYDADVMNRGDGGDGVDPSNFVVKYEYCLLHNFYHDESVREFAQKHDEAEYRREFEA